MTNSFDKLTEAALDKILFIEYEHLNSFQLSRNVNGQLAILVDSSEAFEQSLIFYDALIAEEIQIPEYYSDFYMTEQEGGYCLEFKYPDESENRTPYKMFFSTANAEIQCYNYTKIIVPYYEPLHSLAVYLSEMRNKRDRLGSEYLNDEERKILPLYDFIPLIQHLSIGFEETIIFEAEKNQEGDILRAANELFVTYAEQAQAKEIEKLARQHAESSAGSKSKRSANRKLQQAFTTIEGESLYRFILSEIRHAGSRYPDKIDSIGKSADAAEMRESISSFFRSQGFEGDYPSFRKRSFFKGLRIIQMTNPFDAEVFWNERNMASLIHCCEDCVHGEFVVSYIAGTVLLKKGQMDRFHSLSADSGFFREKKKRRRGRIVINQFYWNDLELPSVQEENLKTAEIASRVSQCDKITKEERRDYLSSDPLRIETDSNPIIFSLFWGLLFVILMCIGFVPMAVAAGWIIERSFPIELLSDIPWAKVFLFSAIISWIAMFLIFMFGGRRG